MIRLCEKTRSAGGRLGHRRGWPLDGTAELKQGRMTVGVARQHAGITGQVENCQTVVFMAYVTSRGHAPFDFRLYLPKSWCADRERREGAAVPEGVEFATKTEQGTEIVTTAISSGVPFAFLAGDEVYGRSSKLRAACERHGKGYVLAVPVNFTITLPSRRRVPVASLARLVPACCWETRSCGPGCKGHREYHWAWAATASPRHHVLIRRSISDPSALLTQAAGAVPAVPAQPPAWADTGALPSSAHEPAPEDPGMVKVSVPEARRLLNLATTPMTAVTRQLGYAWSRWRRKHQARARYHHSKARLRAAPT